MADFDLMRRLHTEGNPARIVLLVMDGLGGLPRAPGGLTELETARTPNMDALCARGSSRLPYPVALRLTRGSGPAHLALFGYNPVRFDIGRGVLEALGIDFPMTARDVAARGNFCSLDADGNVTDRRAGRIDTDTCIRLCGELSRGITIPAIVSRSMARSDPAPKFTGRSKYSLAITDGFRVVTATQVPMVLPVAAPPRPLPKPPALPPARTARCRVRRPSARAGARWRR